MYTSIEYVYLTHYHSNLEDHMGSGFITCTIGYPLKICEWEGGSDEGKVQGSQIIKVGIQVHMGNKYK